MKNETNKGITLIALVITIIILLILAGVSIATLTGENGLLTKVREAGNESIKGMEREQIAIAYISIISEQKEIGSENLENRLKADGAKVLEVGEIEEGLRIKFETGNNYYVDKNGNITEYILTLPLIPEIAQKPEEEIIEQFNKANGVIEIAWIDINNNVIKNPMRITKSELGGMTPVKWEGNAGNYEEKNTEVTDSNWYKYEEQKGDTKTEGTSRWANAKAKSGENEAYFVWIPRYSYKIIYFDNEENKENYRKDNTKQTGIIGYSTAYGMIDVRGEIPKIVEGTKPVNIEGKVETEGYKDYIVHPGFEFGGSKKGIWVGKYEPSGTIGTVTVVPNVESLRNQTLSNMHTASQALKTTYGLPGDTHIMKNIEWGAVSYLAESKYGRNGTEITINNSMYITGNAGDSVSASKVEGVANSNAYDTGKGVLASTTGNIYGIYDMSGGAYEYVAAYLNNSQLQSNTNITDLRNAVAENPEYADIYTVNEDTQEKNYQESRKMYGDAIQETSTSYIDSTSWNLDYSHFPHSTNITFIRGGGYFDETNAGWASYVLGAGGINSARSFRVVYVAN